MKIVVKILNILGTILASLVTPVLILLMIVTPVVEIAVSFFDGNRLMSLVEDVDIVSVLKQDDDYHELPAAFGVEDETFEEILRSDTISDIVAFYIDDAMEVVSGDKKKSELTAEKIKSIFDKNMDEIAKIVRETDPGSAAKTDSQIKEEMHKRIDRNFEKIADKLPPADTVVKKLEQSGGLGEGEMRKAIFFVRNDLLPLFIGMVVFLSILILVGKFYRFKGFIWLGIVYIFSGAVMFVIASSVGPAISSALPDAQALVRVADTFITTVTNKYAVAYAMIGAALIVVYIILKLAVVNARKEEKAPVMTEQVKINFKPQPQGPEFETVSMGAARPDMTPPPATGTPYTEYNAQYGNAQYGTPYNAQQYGTPYNAQAAAPAPAEQAPAPVENAPAAESVKAPLSGKILEIKVSAGDEVKKGDTVLVLEAMKMENEITAARDGRIKAVFVSAGQDVEAGGELYTIE